MAFAEGRPQRVDYCLASPDRLLRGLMIPETDSDGVASVRACIWDVAEELGVHRQFSETVERYTTLFQTMSQGIVYQEPNGTVVLSNPAARQIFGEDLCAVADFLSPESGVELVLDDGRRLERDELPAHTALRSKKRTPPTLIGWRKPGCETLWLRTEAVPLFRAGGQDPYLVYTIFEDVSRQKQMRERLRRSEKLEAVGQLAGGIAHDFNNVLTAIMGYARALEESVAGQDLEDVAEIHAAAERASGLTRQLLEFARHTQGERRVLDVHSVLRSMEGILRRLIGEHILVTSCLEARNPFIEGDVSQLEQVVVNLAVNARDAMPQGGVFNLATRNTTMDGVEHLVIEATDTGAGMSSELANRIFEPFFTTKEVGKGTGLGLATVYSIVTQLEGTIDVESSPGAGSVFRVAVPVTERARTGGEMESGRPQVRTCVSGTALVVEDEPALRQLMKRMLSRHGVSVILAQNGVEAEILFAERGTDIDIVVTDLVMPGMRGSTLINRLRTARPGLPAVVVSGYPANSDEEIDPGGPTSFIAKPFTEEDLVGEIAGLLTAGDPTSDPVGHH